MTTGGWLILTLILLAGGIPASGAINAVPLKERSDVEKGRLFSELDADQAGVGGFVNDYSSPDVWGAKWQQYLLGSIGSGVAIGDVDGDHWPDLFIVSKDEGNKLYRNLGDMRFADVTPESGIKKNAAPGTGCAFVDIDNDGDLDLYVCYVGGPNQLWINDGSGRFTERAVEWGVAVSSGSNMAAFADYDRDGDIDLYLQMNSIMMDGEFRAVSDQLFENRGGRFVEVTAQAGISGAAHGHSATWWDYDEDGWPDLYVTRDYEPLDKLYKNNRDGTFTDVLSSVIPVAPYYSMSADFGDINNDGHFDFWVTDMPATTRYKHMRTIANHDHVYKNHEKGVANQYVKNVLALKLSDTQFADIAHLAGLDKTDWTWASRLVDLDNDGWLDAFVSNGMFRSFGDGDLGVKRQSAVNWVSLFRPSPVLNENNLAYRNNGDLTFQSVGREWGLDKMGISFGTAFGDLDRNGTMDLVVVNYGQKLSVYRNNEGVNRTVIIRLKGTTSNRFGIGARVTAVAGDLRQVKALSLTRGYMSTDEPIIQFGLGTRTRIDSLEIEWPSGIRQRFENLAVGFAYEIEESGAIGESSSAAHENILFTPISPSFPPSAKRKEADFSDSKVQPLLPFPESRLGGSVAIGDLDGNGLNDLVLSGASGQATAVWINRGNGVFEDQASLDIEDDFVAEDRAVALADVDGDGALDLWVASGGIELARGDSFHANRVYRNEGNGELVRDRDAYLPDGDGPSSTLAIGDYDGDGDADVFVGGGTIPGRYPYATPARLYRNVGGRLTRVDQTAAPGLAEVGRVSDAVFVDMDGDGDQDLVLAREWSTPMIWINDKGTFTAVPGAFDPSLSSGLWGSVAVADLDGNGRMDIVVGNLGLNTTYRAVAGEPMRLWYSSEAAGRVKLIHTTSEDGHEWPLETKARLQAEFPKEVPRSMSFEVYAGSNLATLFPGRIKEGYQSLEINELRSGIFWQEGDGRFSFEPLPMFAQSGRIMDLLAVDLNHDGHLDIVATLDSPRSEPRAERFEKGHLAVLLNKGKRTFEALLPRASGLSIDGAPRGLGWGDVDGDGAPELIVVLSEGIPQVFKRPAGVNAERRSPREE